MQKRIGLILILIFILLLNFKINPENVRCAQTQYYSCASIVYHGTEITNHTLTHISDDKWYQTSSEDQDPFQILSLTLIFSTNHYPTTITQISLTVEGHIETIVTPNVIVRIHNFNQNKWLNLFYITNTTDAVYKWNITDNPSEFMNETGHVELNFFYYHFYPQTLFIDFTSITIIATKPRALFTYTPNLVQVNQTILFNASSSYDPDGYITSYYWNFGDGTNATGIIVTHSYNSIGNYTVTLTVTDNDGQQDSLSMVIWCKKSPIARFFYSPQNPSVNQTITFNASESTPNGGQITTYLWDLGDGTNKSGKIVTHEYSSTGNYKVSLLVVDSEGLSGSMSALIRVDLHDVAIYNINYWPHEAYRGIPVTIALTVKNEGTAFETFNATVYYGHDNIPLETKNIINLAPNEERTVMFTWNTRDIIYYIYYPISAKINPLAGEIDTTDNTIITGSIYIRMIGDANDDAIVDSIDLGLLGQSWGFTNESINYDWKVDFNGDGLIDSIDLGLLGWYWGKTRWDDSTFKVIHSIQVDTNIFYIMTISNSTVSNVTFSQTYKRLTLTVNGPSMTYGFCEITFLKTLLGGPYTVLVDGREVPWLLSTNFTHITVKVSYLQSTHTVSIIGTTAYPNILNVPSTSESFIVEELVRK
jgi:PKD repeat protein